MSEFVVQLRKFVVDNNIVGSAAGVCIALATKEGIQSLVQDIIIPSIVILLHSLHVDWLTKILPVHGKSPLNVLNFVNQLVTWFLIIIISFVFVKLSFEYLLGITNTKNDKPKTDDKTDSFNNPMNPNTKSIGMEGFYYQ
jgi:large-conductance mechanosensitive channel